MKTSVGLCQQENINYFFFQNQIYLLKCQRYEQLHQIRFIVEEKKSFQHYQTDISQITFPKELKIYQNVSNLFKHISSNPQHYLSYSLEGKFILITDYIEGKTKYIRVALSKRSLTNQEQLDAQFIKAQKRIMQLEQENKQIRIDLVVANNKIGLLQFQLRNKKQEEENYGYKLSRTEELLELVKRQNLALRRKVIVETQYLWSNSKEQGSAKKRKKINEEGGAIREINANEQVYTQAGISQNQKQANGQTQLVKKIKTDSFIIKQLMVMSIPQNQRNYNKFIITSKTIVKNFGQKKGHLLYFKPTCDLRKTTKPTYLQFQNLNIKMKGNSQDSSPDFNILIGVISSREKEQLSTESESIEETIYLNTVQGILCSSKNEVDLNCKCIFKYQQKLVMLINIEQLQLCWFVDDSLVCESTIHRQWLESEIYPFIQLFGKGNRVSFK